MTYYWVCNKSNTTDATIEARTTYPSGAPIFTPCFGKQVEDTKGVIRSCKSKDRQYNGHKKKNKRTNNTIQNTTQKTTD
jgi:hypothetical protein